MSALGILLAVAGLIVTSLVIVAMVLLTPSGEVDVQAEGTEGQGQGTDLSPLRAPHRPERAATTT